MSTRQEWPPTQHDIVNLTEAIDGTVQLAGVLLNIFPPDSIYIRVAQQALRSAEADAERLTRAVEGDPWMVDEVLADLNRRYGVVAP